jgi:hypothetical protein
MLVQGGGRKVSPKQGSETIGGGHSREYVEREIRDDNEVYLLISFLTVPDKKII